MVLLNLTQENFDREVLSSPKPAPLGFRADWRGPGDRLALTVDSSESRRRLTA